ncbi:hypothetical protein MMC29_003949 [Sticta canariensis]|nr:hypothetical protein [Sticta canariensis]
MEEIDEILISLSKPNIFDLDLIDNGMIAGTPVETFNDMRPMLDELLKLEKMVRRQKYEVTEEDLSNLYRKYPFLEFTKRAAGPGGPSSVANRMRAWEDARCCLDLPAPYEEKQVTQAFSVFLHEYNFKESFQFLKRQPSAEIEEYLLLDHAALDELWALTQRLKFRPLTPSQEEDRQKLEQFVESEMRITPINMEDDLTERLSVESGPSSPAAHESPPG